MFGVSIVRIIVGLVGVLWLAIAGAWLMYEWDRRPAGWPNIEANLLFWHPRFGFGDGLAAQLDKVKPQLLTCQANEAKLTGAINAQNASLAALSAKGSKALADAEDAVSAYRRALATASSRVRVISAPIVGDDVCTRVKNFDATFVASLGQ